MNDMKNSKIQRGIELSKLFKTLEDDIKIRVNYRENIANELLDIMEEISEVKIGGVKKVEKSRTQTISIARLKEVLNIETQDEILDRLMVEVNIPESEENLRYLSAFQEVITKKIVARLEENNEIKYSTLEIVK